jgi:thiamine biosynthesis lipoprotein
MGTELVVLAPESAPATGPRVRALFAEWEQRFSRFRPESELSRVNAAAGRTVAVSAPFAEVASVALAAARATGGLFDPTLLEQLLALGYDRTFRELPADRPARLAALASAPGGAWREIELDLEARTIRLPAGVGLDFGGLVKGMAVDAALAVLAADDAGPSAVDAGGDLAVLGTPPGGDAWPIALVEADGAPIVGLVSGALATSTVTRRRWRVDGEERHHLVDPRTGRPAESGLRAATVAASTCQAAEVACKAALLLGAEEGRAFLERHGLSGLLVTDDGHPLPVGGWVAGWTGASSGGASSGGDASTPGIAAATDRAGTDEPQRAAVARG